MSDGIDVKLTWAEVLVAATVGCMRNVQSQRDGRVSTANMGWEDTWGPNIDGACAEMAVAKHFGRFWSGALGDLTADDVGPFQVRCNTSRRLTDTILRPGRDQPDKIYIGVLSYLPSFVVMGWIKGADGMRKEWLRQGSPGRPDCYFVPRSALRPLDKLVLPRPEGAAPND